MARYDVFISYSSQDRPWAEHLYQSLVGRGLKPFFDKHSLRDGQGWEAQLNAGLRDADHMVCLWSANAFASMWVQNELGAFRASIAGNKSDSKLLIVRLDDRHNAFSSTQQIDMADIKTAYAQSPPTPPEGPVWIGLVDRVENALRQAAATIEIPLVLLTLTQDQVQDIGPNDRAKLKARLGIGEEALVARYGTEHLQWNPFGTQKTIGEILDLARGDLNKWLAPETMAWNLPGDSFWSDHTAARDFARRMANCRLGAIVIDPVAMLVANVQAKLGLFTACLNCENVAIIAVPITPAPELDERFRGWLSDFAATLFDTYLEPPGLSDPMPNARYGVGVGDAGEVRRLLQRSVGDFLRKTRKQVTPNPITGYPSPR